MKMTVTCMKCQQDLGRPDFVFYRPDVLDEGLIEFTCRYGHHSKHIIQAHKFKLLFDLGANAIYDGYYREAVATFTASMERFFEFYIRLIAKNSISSEVFEPIWKSVSSQSERQLGAFTFIYAMENSKAPKLLSQAMTTFRNKVIHKGHIPTRDEAISYGDAVIAIIDPKIVELNNSTDYSDCLSSIEMEHLSSRFLANTTVDTTMSSLFAPTILSTHTNTETPSLSHWLETNMRNHEKDIEHLVVAGK